MDLRVASVLLAVLPHLAFSGEAVFPSRKLDSLLARTKLERGSFAILIAGLKTGDILYSRDPDRPLNPASGIKVLIAAAGLAKLGPDYRFETVVARSGNDLCLIGGGDPALVYEQLLPLVDEVLRAGARRIEGGLIVDSTRFPTSRDALNDFEGDRDRAFTAPVSALSLDFNSLAVHVRPAGLNQPPRVTVEPDLASVGIKNRAKTVPTAGPKDIGASVSETKNGFDVEIFGRIGAEAKERTLYRSVSAPELLAGHAFADRFRKEGGTLGGNVRSGICPPAREVLVRFPSKPLSEIVGGMSKFSNNFIAEMLARAVGAEPTVESGLKEIAAWLALKGIPTAGLKMENASGLSKDTRVSARTLVEAARAAAADFKTGPEFSASLPIAGVDGTLRRRLKDAGTRGLVRGKSGMLKGVVSLTGLAESPTHGTVAFSFLFNTVREDAFTLLRLEEDLLRSIVAPAGN